MMVVFHAEHFTCARQFCQLLEEWNRNVAVCKDSLQGLEQLLQSLNAQQAATLSVPDTAFMTLAPSAALHNYLLRDKTCKEEVAEVDLLHSAQDHYTILQEVVHTARRLCSSLRSAFMRYQQSLSRPTAHTHLDQGHDSQGMPHDLPTDEVEIHFGEELPSIIGHVQSANNGSTLQHHQQEPYTFDELEVGLLMSTLLKQLELELALMVKMSAVNLATPAPEVRTYTFLCDLQPFLDVRLVSALRTYTEELLTS